MKKIFAILAAAVAAFSLVSCNKEQIEVPSNDLRLNIKVADLDGSADTKAVKAGWTSGDKLNIWFDETNYANPDLVIKYDGSEWKKDASATVSGKAPAASGQLIILYEGNNDWNKYTHTSQYLYPRTEAFAGAVNGYTYAQHMAYSNYDAIAYTYESNTLSANLNSWKCLTKIQVVISGLDSSKASRYALKEQNMSRGIVYFSAASITTSMTTMKGCTLGVPNEDGVAFYFTGSHYDPSSRTFTLLDLDTMQEATYAVTGKSLNTSTSKIACVKIAASKFYGAAETTGTAKRNGDVDVN